MCQCCNEVDKWKEYIARGNTEFTLKYYGNAILMFNQALDHARFDFGKTAKISYDRAISKVVICYFNLADCYIALDQIERACDYYQQAQRFLLQLSEDSIESPAALYKAVNHAGSHMNEVWMGFVKKYREEVGYDRLMKFHQSSIVLTNSEQAGATCH